MEKIWVTKDKVVLTSRTSVNDCSADASHLTLFVYTKIHLIAIFNLTWDYKRVDSAVSIEYPKVPQSHLKLTIPTKTVTYNSMKKRKKYSTDITNSRPMKRHPPVVVRTVNKRVCITQWLLHLAGAFLYISNTLILRLQIPCHQSSFVAKATYFDWVLMGCKEHK